MKILITGSRGFVAKNLLEHPGMASHTILSCGRGRLAQDTAIVTFRPDMVIHLAGRVGGIQDNINQPVRFLLDNLEAGIGIVEAAMRHKVPKLLNVGSSCMYPLSAEQPFREESLLTGLVEPTNEPYALAKLTVMRLCQYVERSCGHSYKTIIPPGLYGRHAHFEGDQAHLVSAILARLHRATEDGVTAIGIWGDGTARREFLFAGDLADCIVRALDNWPSMPAVMNVGTGTDLSVNDWTRQIAAIVGYEGKFYYDRDKPQGAAAKVMDVSKAKEWGWAAKTTVEDGLKVALAHYLEEKA